MSVLVNKNTRVLVQGITGTQGSFHTKKSIEYGTNIVVGTSPNHKDENYLGIPVFNNINEATKNFSVDACISFVPAIMLKSAMREIIEAEIGLAVAIANGVPVHDMLEIKAMLKGSKTLMIGPNTPGIITPSEARLGLFPENIHHKGNVGIISRSSTLTYEAVIETNLANLGQSTVVGLGDDMIIGTDYREILRNFVEDEETKAIVLVGKADGTYEQLVAEYYKSLHTNKPVIAAVVGESYSLDQDVGYAGDIITGGHITIQDKKKFMQNAGMIVVNSLNQIHSALTELNL